MNDTNNNIEPEKQTDFSLLLDSKYPLLQDFREKCPGTFKHAQALVGIVESVSTVLNLDIDFMKVAALYHDVGKAFNPKYFTENQLEDEDPHKKLDPWISFQIISRHVSDSVSILVNDDKFPREIIQIISQHHGSTLVKFFCDKAKTKDKNIFRYQGATPKCIESAVLMICDHIEARSRSLVQANKYDPDTIIDNTINGLLDDGQLDDVHMRLGDLKKIKVALAKELEGLYQKRVDYDSAAEEAEEN
jgi:putative nucleotidyltransferase with HDIG domain